MQESQHCTVRTPVKPLRSQCLCLQLFEVINQDYNDFVDLSTKLVNVEAAVLQFQAPLEEVQVERQAAVPFMCWIGQRREGNIVRAVRAAEQCGKRGCICGGRAEHAE